MVVLCAVWGLGVYHTAVDFINSRVGHISMPHSAITRRCRIGWSTTRKSAKLPPRNYSPEQLQSRNANKPVSLGVGHTQLWFTYSIFSLNFAPESGAVCTAVVSPFCALCIQNCLPTNTEPTINICYREGAVVPHHGGVCPSFFVLRVSNLFLWFFFFFIAYKNGHSIEKPAVSQNQFLCIMQYYFVNP